jgi:hypothetical protein
VTGDLRLDGHEPWCDPILCDAATGRRGAAHRSAPFVIDASTVQWVRHVGPLVGFLEQPVLAIGGGSTTYLRIQPADDDDPQQVVRVPIAALDDLMARVGALLGRAVDGREDPVAAARPVPPYVTGYQVGPMARAGAGNAGSRYAPARPARVVGRV